MIANNDMNRWCALYTAPRSERKLMQRLNEAGYAAFCPMQIVFRKWNGKTKEVFTPLFPGFLFVEVSLQNRLPFPAWYPPLAHLSAYSLMAIEWFHPIPPNGSRRL